MWDQTHQQRCINKHVLSFVQSSRLVFSANMAIQHKTTLKHHKSSGQKAKDQMYYTQCSHILWTAIQNKLQWQSADSRHIHNKSVLFDNLAQIFCLSWVNKHVDFTWKCVRTSAVKRAVTSPRSHIFVGQFTSFYLFLFTWFPVHRKWYSYSHVITDATVQIWANQRDR